MASYETFAYGPDNRRVWRHITNGDLVTEELYIYGVDGRKLATYRLYREGSGEQATIGIIPQDTNIYFAGKLINAQGKWVAVDRLGSVRANSQGERFSYYPYGEERTATSNAREKFGTYFRDTSGTDYADQRYYLSSRSRFMTPDPYQASGGPADPQSWNRYAYTRNDPINRTDRSGLRDGEPSDDVVDCGPFGMIPSGACSSFLQASRTPEYQEPSTHESQGDKRNTAAVVSSLVSLRKAIDLGCLKFLESGIAGDSVTVFDRYFNELLGTKDAKGLAGAQNFSGTSYQGANATVESLGNGYALTVNSAGAFFSSSVGVGYADKYDADMKSLTGGTTSARNFILLHELAHFLHADGFIEDDGMNVGRQKFNNDLIWKNCAKTIRGPMM